MPLTRLNRDGVLERSATLLGALEPAQQHTVLPWDDPPSFASLQLKNKQTPGHLPRHIQVRTSLGFQAELPGCFCDSRSDVCDRGSRQRRGAAAVFTVDSCWDVVTLTCGAVPTGGAWNGSSAGAGPHPELQAQIFVRPPLLGAPRCCRLLPGRSFLPVVSTRARCSSQSSRSVPNPHLQVLQSVWDRFCCVDVFTGRLNNMVYMFCHNPTGPSRHSREFWDAGLHTDVRFRSVCGRVEQVSGRRASLIWV